MERCNSEPSPLEVAAPEFYHVLCAFECLDPIESLILVMCARLSPIKDVQIQKEGSGFIWQDEFLRLAAKSNLCRLEPRFLVAEIFSGLRRAGTSRMPTQERLSDLVCTLDIDQNGFVDWDEWLALAFLASLSTVNDTSGLFDTLLHEQSPVFRLLDAATGDGVISVEDLLEIVKPSGQDSVSGPSVKTQLQAFMDRPENADHPSSQPTTQLSAHDLQRKSQVSVSTALHDCKRKTKM